MRRSAIATSALALSALAWPVFAQRPNQGEDDERRAVDEGRTSLKRGELDDAA